MADRILVLREGRLVAELPGGSSEEDVMRAAAMGAAEEAVGMDTAEEAVGMGASTPVAPPPGVR